MRSPPARAPCAISLPVRFALSLALSVCRVLVVALAATTLSSSAARRLLVAVRCAGASRRNLTMRGHLRFVMCFAALGGTAATTEVRNSFTESRGRSGTCSPGAACDCDTRCDHGVSLSKGRLVLDAASHSAAICAPVNFHLTGTFFSAFGFGGLLLMAVISILVVACVMGAEGFARARDARKPDDDRNRCAQGRASAASPRQKTSLPQLGRAAAAQLRPVMMLCLVSAVSAVPLATDVNCLPYRTDEVHLDLTGAKPQRFLMCTP